MSRKVARLTLDNLAQLDALLDEGVGEGVVLLAGPLHPQHVVEEQVVAVRRGETAELEPRAVQEDAPERPDLGIDVEGAHDPILFAARRGQ